MQRIRIGFWIGLLLGLVAGVALLTAPSDRDSLFLHGFQQSLSGEVEAWAGLESPAPGVEPSALRLTSVEILSEAGSELPARTGGVETLEELRRRTRSVILQWNNDSSGARHRPIHWTGEAPDDGDSIPSVALRLRVGLREGATTCRLEVIPEDPTAVEPRSRPADEAATHDWPLATSLLPPLIAIFLALLLRRTIPALLGGVLVGCWLMTPNPIDAGRTLVGFVWLEKVFGDNFRLEIIGFVIFLCMAIGVMSRSGGIQGMVNWLSRFARGPRSTQMVAYLSGVLLFFDDYANCIIVGNTMRPLTDSKRISREKLAYIVDSTAAPVAAIALLSTWVAYEISMFAPQLSEANPLWTADNGFEIFVRTLPFRFYCFFTLFFIFLTIVLRREFGPMLRAERRAWHEGQPADPNHAPMVSDEFDQVEMKGDIEPKARNGLVPILMLIGVTILFMWITGRAGGVGATTWDEWIRGVLSEAASTQAILWGSAAALLLASVLALGQRLLSLGEVLIAALRSARALFFAVIILILAWSIGIVCEELETAPYLVSITSQWIRPELLPTILFVTSCLVAFATGSSWSTMAILLPNVVVLAWTLGAKCDIGSELLLVMTIGAVLEGSIFGDHCSPISDTTVLSSVATASNHLDHVKTQVPYALVTMAVTLVVGYLPVALLGVSPFVCFPLGGAVLAAFLLTSGRDPADGS